MDKTDYWKNALWTYETKGVLFGDKQAQHSSLRTLSHLLNMVGAVSWYGSTLLHLDQDNLPLLIELWTTDLHKHILQQNVKVFTEAQKKVELQARQQPQTHYQVTTTE